MKIVKFEKIEKFYNDIKEGKYRKIIEKEFDYGNLKELHARVFVDGEEWYVIVSLDYNTRSAKAYEYKLKKVFFTE